MNCIVRMLIEGKPVTDKDLASELYEICDSGHGSCGSDCPVFNANGGIPYETSVKGNWRSRECSCFKDGIKMLAFIRDRLPKAGVQSIGEPISMVAHGKKGSKVVKSSPFVKLPRKDKMEEMEERLGRLEKRFEVHTHPHTHSGDNK